MEPVDPLFLAWLAGFIDGEGCFSIHVVHANGSRLRCAYSPFLVIANTHRPTLDHIATTLQLGRIHEIKTQQKQRNPRWRSAYQYQASGKAAVAVTQLVRPYLRSKREQAELLLRFPLGTQGRATPDDVWATQALLHEELKELKI